MLSSSNFKVLGLTLRSLIHFELILYRVRERDIVSVFYVWISSFPMPFVEEAVFSPEYVSDIFVENQMAIAMVLFLVLLFSSIGLCRYIDVLLHRYFVTMAL
jgi:hypothetical protein